MRWCRYSLGLLQKDVAAMVGIEEWLYRDLESGAFHRSFTPELADKLAALSLIHILSVSDLLLHNLNHSYASLMEQTKGSLKNLFYKKDATFLDNAHFRQIQGEGEGRILTADGSPVDVLLDVYKRQWLDNPCLHRCRISSHLLLTSSVRGW